MKRGPIATTQATIERRQRALLSQIATQRAAIAEAEARIAQLTFKLQETAPGAYSRMLEKRAAEILRSRTEVAS